LSRVVLDASALLALLNAEPGAEEVERAIPGAVISSVNLSEVVAKLDEAGMPKEAVREALTGIELEVYSFDLDSAFQAGALRRPTRKLGLSFGDRACIALGLRLGLTVLTADRNWGSLEVGAEVRAIR
jgi:PIN domain nuclease of toxin-antitoxin system